MIQVSANIIVAAAYRETTTGRHQLHFVMKYSESATFYYKPVEKCKYCLLFLYLFLFWAVPKTFAMYQKWD